LNRQHGPIILRHGNAFCPIIGNVFREPGRREVRQPIEYLRARCIGDAAICIEIRLGDVLGVELQ